MKVAIFAFIGFVSVVATCLLYGWLEGSVNMMEGFGQLFAPGATTVLFSPFLLLFILLSLFVFVAVSFATVAGAAAIGGFMLRFYNQSVPRDFIRSFIIVAAVCQFALIWFSAEENAWFLIRRPVVHPRAPVAVLALMAAANAVLNLVVAGLIVRRVTSNRNRLPSIATPS